MRKQTIIRELTEAVEKLHHLTDTGPDSRCGVQPEHKEAIRSYVEIWITPLVESALLGVKEECSCGHAKASHRHGLYGCNICDETKKTQPDSHECYGYSTR